MKNKEIREIWDIRACPSVFPLYPLYPYSNLQNVRFYPVYGID
jgi:hypothetical protein